MRPQRSRDTRPVWILGEAMLLLAVLVSLQASLAHSQITYADAVRSGAPHTCEFTISSFFGGHPVFTAEVEGNNFFAREKDSNFAFAREGKWGAGWYLGDDEGGQKIDLDRFGEAYRKLYGRPMGRWEHILVFAEPGPEDACRRGNEAKREPIPEHVRDTTDMIIERVTREKSESLDILAALSFRPILPQPPLTGFDQIRGHAASTGYSLEYIKRSADDFSQMRMSFSLHATPEPEPTVVIKRKYKSGKVVEIPLKRKIKARPRQYFATTPKGHEIFVEMRPMGNHRPTDQQVEFYTARIGDIDVTLSHPHWRYGPTETEYWSHAFAPGELERIFDSLESATPEELIRFPEMTVMR